MMKVGLIRFLFLFLILAAPTAYAQKVKYKDIFGLLSNKQYEEAEPFLKRYLKENDDNGNAYLYMGIIFQEKSLKDDVLKQTRFTIAHMDSAIFFYDKALKVIDEKEVRRNKEQYQIYNRRDLRTGEFGVKLSDIQFDLEKKIEGLKERIDKVKMVKYYFSLTDSLYKRSNVLFRSIQDAYPGEREFYLRSDDKTLSDLINLSVRFDSCTRTFENYKTSSSNLGKTGYNQTLALNEIANFKKDGTTPANFYQDDLQIWNYKKFADKTKETIEKEIIPMRDHLIAYDIEINKLREKLNRDSLSVRNDLTKLIDKLLMDQLKKYDEKPLPMQVFSLKVADLEYRSLVLEHKPLRDSADVQLRLKAVKDEFIFLNRLDSIASDLSAQDIDAKILDYNHFITNTYSNSIVLKSYIKALKEFADRERRKKDAEILSRTNALNWILNGMDSIPLVPGITRSKFKPLMVVEEKFTVGLMVADSLNSSGYLFSITPSRIPDIKIDFPVDKPNFKLARISSAKALSFSDAVGQVFFVLVYSERMSKEKYPTSLAKIYRSDGLAWSNNIQLGFLPKELIFKPDTGELTIRGDSQVTTVDKNGKMVK